ncbi:MAG TPA: UDP-3-O-(3-hydroxymyristoyl)glucosamine N-acyltransferase [Pyrinomonadaceae bacterium]|jgi:UDP-3-O-[3-hydroxymyristoyl] glucosamine N-acyltransferase
MSSETEGRTAAELAALVGGRVVGDGAARVARVASLETAGADAVAFVEDAKLLSAALASGAACLLVPEGAGAGVTEAAARAPVLIEVARPKLAFAQVAALLHPPKRRAPELHPTAVIAESARLGADVFVGAYVCVGDNTTVGARTHLRAGAKLGDGVTVGADCVIHPNVFLEDGVTIGDRVILHAGVVVGADGFGYVRAADGYHKFPQLGTVVVGDDVEIGAHSCVDRGALGATRIGAGTKIDNLVQVGHNVQIGARVVIAAQTGISGSTVIEDDAVIGGQVGFGDHARVEAGAVIGSKAGVLPGKIVRAGTVVWGVPVRPLAEYKRLNAHFGRLPQLKAQLDDLRRRVADLEAQLAKTPDEQT